MPRRDGSGPMGMGPMTGWGRGYCRPRGYGYRRSDYGAGLGYGRGLGRFGPWGGYNVSQEDEKKILEDERSFLRDRLNELEDILGDRED